MEDLSRIQARLENLRSLSELVDALRSMASTRTREAREALAGTRRYRGVVEQAIREIVPLSDRGPRDMPEVTDETGVLVLVTSENGFVGGFNRRLVEAALSARDPEERILIVGKRGLIAAREHGLEPKDAVSMTSRKDGVTPLARRLARSLDGAHSVRLVFARPEEGAGYGIDIRRVLPMDLANADAVYPLECPLHHLHPSELISGLSDEYLFAMLADALMESLASENGARLRTMDASSRNIADRVETLTREERFARQEKTTSDMLDIVTGAEAVNRG